MWGEDAVGESQRRAVTWDCSCLDKDAEGFSFQLQAATARLGAQQELGIVCDKKKKKAKKSKVNVSLNT